VGRSLAALWETIAVNAALFPRRVLRLGCTLLLLAGAATAGHAQNSRQVHAVPQPAAPANAATLGLPKPAGLPSRFPAGLPETGVMGDSGTPIGVPPATTNNITPGGTVTTPDTGGTTTAGNTGATGTTGTTGNSGTPSPSVTGTGVNSAGVAYLGAAAPQGPVSGPAGNYTPLQIAQSFLGADANHDGELTRAEFQHLTIKPYTFEEMDRDHDGIVTRFEYDDAVR
jgi:hypothetical protein